MIKPNIHSSSTITNMTISLQVVTRHPSRPSQKHGTGAGIPSQRPTSSVPQYSLEILSAWLHFASLRSELVLLRHELQPWTDTGLISTPLQPFRPYVCHAKRPTMCLEHLMMLIQLNRKHNHRALYSVCISTIFSLED